MDDNPREEAPDTSGPRIIRPIPRRPFNLNFSSPTPPEEDDNTSSRPQISASDLRFLAPHQQHTTPGNGSRDGSTPLSHTTSYLNLTSPTLFGIYSPSTLSSFNKDEDDQDQDQDRDQYVPDPDRSNTSSGSSRNAFATGIDTPIDTISSQPGLDEETYSLIRERRRPSHSRHGPSTLDQAAAAAAPSPKRRREVALQLVLRAALLFALGVGYGVLVTRLPQNSHHRLAAYESHYEWRYLVFWGAAGVALGSLLPWFDRFWEETVSGRSKAGHRPPPNGKGRASGATNTEGGTVEAPVIEKPSAAAAPQADWALVVRGIGAFVGIVFAIRKLPWASTMQVSLTLALANPFLWYLIDRSKPGFLLSAAVGLAGSAVLMGLNPDVMPAPAAAALGGVGSAAAGAGRGGNATATGAAGGYASAQGGGAAFGGLASQETIETSIWMLSVLFCSCVCFGNIGRRLALNSEAAGRGRWGGVR